MSTPIEFTDKSAVQKDKSSENKFSEEAWQGKGKPGTDKQKPEPKPAHNEGEVPHLYIIDAAHPAKANETAHLERSRKQLKDCAGKNIFIESELKRFENDMTDFEKRAAHLGPKEIAKTYEALYQLMQENPGSRMSTVNRVRIAEQVMHQAAYPTSIDQGQNNTCNVTDIEIRAYTLNPSAAAGLVSQVARFGSYITANGRLVIPHMKGILEPEAEEKKYPVADGERSWATRIFNQTAVNIYWSEQTKTPAGKEVLPGSIKYETHPKLRYNPDTKEVIDILDKHADSGERLVDYSDSKKPVLVYDEAPAEKQALVEHPDLPTGAYEDLYQQITGSKEKGFVLAHESQEEPGLTAFRSREQLAARITDLKHRGMLPAILKVNTKHEPFHTAEEGWHVINIVDFDQRSGLVSIDNTWGSTHDHLGNRAISMRMLYLATKPVENQKK